MKDSEDAAQIMQSLFAILVKKHKDYGPMNIAGAPGGPMNGLRVRMYDKLARLNNLIDSGDTPNYESIEDTLIDLANYAIIGLLVQRNQWAGIPNGESYEESRRPQ
jgi:Nucleotide modification associated domain 1